MKNFIEITCGNQPVLINISHIVYLHAYNTTSTCIYLSNEPMTKEDKIIAEASYGVVKALILEASK